MASTAPRPRPGMAAGGRRCARNGRALALAACALVALALVRPTAFAAGGAAADLPRGDAVDRGRVGDLGRREAVLSAGASAFAAAPSLAHADEGAVGSNGPKVTARCAFDFRVGFDKTKPLRRVVIGLFGEEAPVMARTFAQACSGTYTGEAGSAASYLLADVKSVSKDRLIWLADFPGGNYRYKKVKKSKYKEDEVKLPLAGDETKTTETNALRNDRIGRVSMQKGGGTFNFFISPVADAPWLDKENVVVGQVEEGLDVIAEINEVKAAIKGGWINTVAAVGPGPAGDPRSDDFRLEPTEKIRILKSQVLQ